jgi:hypothetical protein
MKNIPTISRWLLAPAFLLFISSCRPNNGYPKNVDGWAPIYASTDSIRKIESVAARSIEDGGKIYIKDKILYQVENGRGIHVIDYSNPSAPQKLGFIRCYGAQELSIQDHYLYTNNVNDLVVIDIANLDNVQVAGRKENMLTMVSTAPPESGYFECPDKSKGEIVGWERKLLPNPKCRR